MAGLTRATMAFTVATWVLPMTTLVLAGTALGNDRPGCAETGVIRKAPPADAQKGAGFPDGPFNPNEGLRQNGRCPYRYESDRGSVYRDR